MKILVIGSGAREHAIAWTLARDEGVSSLICAPGNPGIAGVARCVSADVRNPAALLEVARSVDVDLTVVGPELPLSEGVVDAFVADGRAIVGPTRAAAALEWSKAFAKAFMARHGVPTARFRVCETLAEARAAVGSGEFGYPLVVKADGLAAGKGVVIAEDRAAADAAVTAAMGERRFGSAGERVVLEEFLRGEECSYFVLSDGTRCVRLSSAQDHKRIFDDDRGPNTGGMGAFAPSPLVSADVERRILQEIVEPVLAGMAAEGTPYRGFLYVNAMLTATGPRVVEFNSRFGDPEAQVVLPRLREPLSDLLMAAARGSLTNREALFHDQPHVGVVLAAGGYPDAPESGQPIVGLEAAAAVPGALVFHAGTRIHGGRLESAGGRVLTVVGRAETYQGAIDVAYHAADLVHFPGMQRRSDIGRKAIAALRAHA